jgi:hypothetical protein
MLFQTGTRGVGTTGKSVTRFKYLNRAKEQQQCGALEDN